MILQNVEQQFNFQYPSLYHRLHADGMLHYRRAGEDWETQSLPRIQAHPPLLFYCDFEIIIPEEIREQHADLYAPDDYRKINRALNFIPFGETGGGDLFCFYLQQQGDDIPIVHVYHDADKAIILAKNLQDFIFRMLLHAAENIESDSIDEYIESLKRMVMTHLPYLTEKQQTIVKDVYSQSPIGYTTTFDNGYTENRLGLLTDSTLNELIRSTIFFPLLNTTMPYQNHTTT